MSLPLTHAPSSIWWGRLIRLLVRIVSFSRLELRSPELSVCRGHLPSLLFKDIMWWELKKKELEDLST